MPLTRTTVTAASRVMLPTYALLNVAFGIVFVTDPGSRLDKAPSLVPARDWISLPLWGVMWFALAALMAMALIVRSRWVFVVALSINVAAWVTWALVIEAAVLEQPNVTYLAGTLPLFVATASFASLLSLLRREI